MQISKSLSSLAQFLLSSSWHKDTPYLKKYKSHCMYFERQWVNLICVSVYYFRVVQNALFLWASTLIDANGPRLFTCRVKHLLWISCTYNLHIQDIARRLLWLFECTRESLLSLLSLPPPPAIEIPLTSLKFELVWNLVYSIRIYTLGQ